MQSRDKVVRRTGKRGVSGVVAGFTAKRNFDSAGSGTWHGFRKAGHFLVNCYPRVVTENGSPTGAEAGRRDDGTL